MKVLIADDDALIRDSLKLILELEDDIEVVGTALSGEEAVELCKKYSPDIVLMDIRMPGLDGIIATKQIKMYNKNIKIVILTTFKDDEYISEAIKNGAEGYILKSQSADSIVNSIRMVYSGNGVFQNEILNSIMGMINSNKKAEIKVHLSERELDVLKLIGEGLSNKEIAEKLFLSQGTVRNYVTNLLDKLELRDRTQLALYYVKNF